MKWNTAVGLTLFLGVGGFAVKTVLSPERKSPSELYDEVREQIEVPGFNPQEALRNLDRALSDPSAQDDDELVVSILRLRADIYSRLESWDDAREDIERLTSVYRPGDRDLELSAAELQARVGQIEEAWQRVDRLLTRQPDFGQAYQLRAELETRMGEAHRLQAIERCDRELVPSDALQASKILVEMTARDRSDPARLRLTHELREMFGQRKADTLNEVLDQADFASQRYTQARGSYARSFEDRIEPRGVESYLRILLEAGRPDLAVDFGVSSRLVPEVSSSGGVLRILVQAMRQLGQDERARQMLADWNWKEWRADVEFYREATQLLYEVGDYRTLQKVVPQLRDVGTPADRAAGSFYTGMARFQSALDMGNVDGLRAASKQFDAFLKTKSGDPVPNARALAHLRKAQTHQELGETRLEREQLKGSIANNPSLDGKAYIRLVHLEQRAKNVGDRIPEENWTHAMSLLPQRTQDMLERWRELGQASLTAANLSFGVLYRQSKELSQTGPARDVGPYTRYRFAQRYLAEGNFLGAETVARKLYEDFPGLLPALDTLIEAYIGREEWLRAASRLLTRLELLGPDERSREYLDMIGYEAFTPDERLQLILLDPRVSGRRFLAPHLSKSGEPERVARALIPQLDALGVLQPLSPDLKLERVKALFELARGVDDEDQLRPLLEDCVRLCEEVRDHPEFGPRAFRFLVDAQLKLGDPELVNSAVNAILTLDPVDRAMTLDVCDSLIRASQTEPALALLEGLDGHVDTRGGDVLARLALAQAIAGDHDSARISLERGEAFFADGSVELARILLAIDERDWNELPQLVRALRITEFEPTPRQEAMLQLLEERQEAGLFRASEGARLAPRSPDWAMLQAIGQALGDEPALLGDYFGDEARAQLSPMLLGTADEISDPREILGLMLASDLKNWGHWAESRARAIADRAPLWSGFLTGRVLESVRRTPDAAAMYARVAQAYPAFAPIWDALVRLKRREHRDPLHPEVLAARVARYQAGGAESYRDERALLVDRAATDLANGAVATAREALQQAIAEDQGRSDPQVHALLARIHADEGEYAQAIDQFDLALQRERRESDHPWVNEMIDLLDRAARPTVPRQNRLRPGAQEAYFRTLLRQFPRDPAVILADLERQISSDPRNIPWAVNRAVGAIGTLRSNSNGKTLDELRPGSMLRWSELLRRLSPVLAEEVLQEDLLKRPGDLDLWIQVALARESLGRQSEAHDILYAMVAMSDDPLAHYHLARIMNDRGEDLDLIAQHLEAADKGLGPVSSAPAQFIRAKSQLRGKRRRLGPTINLLKQLWSLREELSVELDPLEVGRTYAVALFRRMDGTDMKSLLVLSRQMQRYKSQDPYVTDLVRAFNGLATSLRTQRNEQNAARNAARNPGAGDGADEESSGGNAPLDEAAGNAPLDESSDTPPELDGEAAETSETNAPAENGADNG